ncbi:hypothetical protein WN943_021991 [Citrus x changshan-huyou]
MSQIEQIEGGLRLMVPVFSGRIKKKLRKSVIAEIASALSVHSSGFVS